MCFCSFHSIPKIKHILKKKKEKGGKMKIKNETFAQRKTLLNALQLNLFFFYVPTGKVHKLAT